MNGIGLVSYMSELDRFFTQIKSLLNPGGQLILDSSDIKYMFQEEDGSMYVDLCKEYYGEVYYQMEYENVEGEKFSWLFLDFDNLKAAAFKNGFECEKLIEDVHFNYLVKVTLI
jgi:cyclopropane fatty-acyl-phospholipid synthase-like methyltransferase